jgi:hypothetical protein
MKKLFILLFGAATLFACNSNSADNKTDEHAKHDNVQPTELTLNNGAKWKADSITNHNVVALKTMADNFRIKPFPSLSAYQILGNDLNTSLNTMIQQCKMTGPDHDMLHQWLEPVLKESNQLKTVTDTAVGRTTFKSIDSRIDAYHNYFE